MSATPPWKIAIVTGEDEYREVKNALLYAEHTHWMAMDPGNWLVDAAKMVNLGKFGDETGKLQTFLRFCWDLKSGGAQQLITLHVEHTDLTVHSIRDEPSGPVSEERVKSLLLEAIRSSIAILVRECRVFVCNLEAFDAPSQNWNSYNAAHALMRGMSRLLLPDVSDLPIEGIMDLREKMKDSLDPMRAEMLSLTLDLRKIVGDSRDPNLLTAEVDNLIATRVEPVVRDADRRANELLQKKWRKTLAGAAKAFGFAGAGFVDPKLFAKAVQQTLETGALALSKPEDHGVSMSETAQFVLRARRLVDWRYKGKG